MVTVRIKVVDVTGATSLRKVTAKSIERALVLVPGEVQFPLREDEFFSPELPLGIASIEHIEGGEECKEENTDFRFQLNQRLLKMRGQRLEALKQARIEKLYPTQSWRTRRG